MTRKGSATFSQVVRWSSSLKSWKTMPILRLSEALHCESESPVFLKPLNIAEAWLFMLNSGSGINGFGRRHGARGKSRIQGLFGFSDGNTHYLPGLRDPL